MIAAADTIRAAVVFPDLAPSDDPAAHPRYDAVCEVVRSIAAGPVRPGRRPGTPSPPGLLFVVPGVDVLLDDLLPALRRAALLEAVVVEYESGDGHPVRVYPT